VRVGIGFDAHPFDPTRPLALGGVRIEGAWGLKGHSDADALLHAVCDACLGAAALGDLGDHFPDSDSRWKGAPSAALLARVLDLVAEKGLKVAQVDATVVAERPRVAPPPPPARPPRAVKATTTNGLGAFGRAEGIGAIAIVRLEDA
jgi:2-C-methyl-D-erythritol 2,4-cyclodiphosphate synthase